MTKKIKKQPTVIGVNKHYEELNKLKHEILMRIEERDDARELYCIETKANNNLRIEFDQLFKENTNLQKVYNESKDYWETNTSTLHKEVDTLKRIIKNLNNELSEYKTKVDSLTLSNMGFENENKYLRAKQKKWYHFF